MSSAPETSVSVDQHSQDFWLESLEESASFTRWVFERIAPFLGASVMEIGCGRGTYTLPMARTGRRILALDIHLPYVEASRERLRSFADVTVVHGDVLAIDPGRFPPVDTVVLLDVLEHLGREDEMLRRARAWLQPGGRLIIKVPAGQWMHSSMDKAIGHYRRYDRASIESLFDRAGFDIEHLEYFNSVAMFGWWLNGKVLKRSTPPAGQLKLFEKLVPVLRTIDFFTRRVFGLSLIVVGRVRS